MNDTVEDAPEAIELLQELATVPDGTVVGTVASAALFLAWVIASRRRTRHLVQLVEAVRRPM